MYLSKELSGMYSELTVHRGKVLQYLGMVFNFEREGKCKITMDGYVRDLLEYVSRIPGTAITPATENLFRVNSSSDQLCKSDREFFHSATAKMLYLGKRVRPDILTAVAFLTKRVQAPTDDDMKKLERLIKYVRGTSELGIILEANKNLAVYGYIDLSHGVHTDMRSHTGTVIGIGKGPLFAKSSSQKINTKSSSESELVGLSDSAGHVIWVRNFLIAQGYTIPAAKIYQDNKSTIALITNPEWKVKQQSDTR